MIPLEGVWEDNKFAALICNGHAFHAHLCQFPYRWRDKYYLMDWEAGILYEGVPDWCDHIVEVIDGVLYRGCMEPGVARKPLEEHTSCKCTSLGHGVMQLSGAMKDHIYRARVRETELSITDGQFTYTTPGGLKLQGAMPSVQ